MATLASTLLATEPVAEPAPVGRSEVVPLAPVRAAQRDAPYERAVYQPSRKAGPVAFLASAGVLVAVGAALMTLNMVAQHKEASHLTVVALKELDTTPPPPPPEKLEQPVAQPEQAFVPKPKLVLPAPGPTQVALDLPPPVQPPVTIAPRVPAPPAPAAAPTAPAAEAVEGGDLSSQVISARPPTYPVDARRRKEEGTVKLTVLVGPDGRVSDIRVSSSSGSDALDRAALSAVKRWRWSPQKANGAAVAVRGTVTIPFVLRA